MKPRSIRQAVAPALVALLASLTVVLVPGAATAAAPTANAGADQVVTVADLVYLDGRVSDDGVPVPSRLAVGWSVVGGPGTVTLARRDEAHTSARFSAPGTYQLRLSVSDGTTTATDDLSVTVTQSAATVVRVPADYPTIQQALDAAPARALVLVSPGTYRENVSIPRTLTLASTYYTTHDEAAVAATVLEGQSTTVETVHVLAGTGAETRVVGFTIHGGNDGVELTGLGVVEHNVITTGTDAVQFDTSSAGLAHDNVMRQTGDDGVDVNHSSAVITDNLIQTVNGDGIEARMTNVTAPLREMVIRGNRILDSRHDGIQVIDDDTIGTTAGSATLVNIDRNIVARSGKAGLGLLDGGNSNENYTAASLAERFTVTSNTFDANDRGISGGDNLVAVDNVFEHHAGPALTNVDGTSRVAYNQFFANGAANVGSNVDAATSYTGDPMLAATTYAPLAGSPVVDRGTASYTLPSGEPAVTVPDYNGSAPDLGAVESGGAAVNRAPVVDAGADATVTLPTSASLAGSVSDDGLPAGSTASATWSQVAGPGTTTFGNPNAASTTAAFSVAGDYTLRLTATDGELSGSDTTTVHVLAQGTSTPTTVQAVVAASKDDAEESSSGSVSLTSADLELVTDGSSVQTVGVRFAGVPVPRGARISAASLQFQVDEVSTDVASLKVQGQAADNPASFSTTSKGISTRARTTAAVPWTPAGWPTVGARGVDQRTPDLSGVVQEIVDRTGWTPGNAMAFVITGTGRRTAEAFDGTGAPSLVVTFTTGGTPPANTAPVVDAGPDRSVTLPAAATLAGSATDDGLPAGSTLGTTWSVVSGPGTVAFASPTSPGTTATFSAAGSYVLRLTGTDGELTSSDTMSVDATAGGGGVVVAESRPGASSDDAEEKSSGSVSLTSSDLELTTDGSSVQTVGMRFPALAVPKGATVVRAWIQLSTDEVTTGATSLTIAAQAADSAATFTTTSRDVSGRARTAASVPWSPAAWSVVGERAAAQRTPDLVALVQEVVNRSGWSAGNAMAFLVTGTGTRTATAFDKSASLAPVLHVEYQ